MRYRNPDPIAAEPARPSGELREFFGLSLIVLAIIVAVGFLIDRTVYYLAPSMPFSWEIKLANNLGLAEKFSAHEPSNAQAVSIRNYLQQRVRALSPVLDVPDTMPLTVHYVDDNTVNAFATLGGHIFVMRGILQRLHTQEEVDAVLAHEMGHVLHRHHTRQASRALLITGLLSAARLNSAAVGRWLLSSGTQVGMLAYSRAAESECDADAIRAGIALYGHSEGLARVMETLEAQGAASMTSQWLNSHPDTTERIRVARLDLPSGASPHWHPLPAFMPQSPS